MNRRPSTARGKIPRRLHRSRLVVLLLLAFALAACDSSTATGSPAGPSPAATPDGIAATPAPGSPAAGDSSEPPSPNGSTDPNASVGPSPSGTTGSASAAACTGSAENRDFYASMAVAVDWTVYCPVLADGWFVQNGQYRLADGGRLEIVYRGPDRAQLTLDGGSFCSIQGGCVPPGVDVGPAAFGDRDGTLVALDDGSWAVAVDREAAFSWLLVVTGLDEAAARAIAAGLVVVGD